MEEVKNKIIKFSIAGMTCRSCEMTIEREWRKINGVEKVDVNAAKGVARIVCGDTIPETKELQSAIADSGYTIQGVVGGAGHSDRGSTEQKRPSWWRLFGFALLVFFLGWLFLKLGVLSPSIALDATTSVGAVFFLGLIAASSSCIAVSGGLLLSSAAAFNERYASRTSMERMRPVLLFVGGRVLSYTLFGGAIGLLGHALSLSSFVTGIVTILAALYMVAMGLDMLHLTPLWLKHITPRLPKSFAHRLLAVETKEHAATPLLLGAATFFLPCGFTQALQLYVLTTGSGVTGAMLLGAFALGTAPALLALGWVSGSIKGNVGRLFFQFTGVLVVMLGIWNIQNGLTILGYPMDAGFMTRLFASGSNTRTLDPHVRFDGKQQTMTMALAITGYAPNRFTIRQGVPTKWVIDGKGGGGCQSVLVVPSLGLTRYLEPGINTIEFTPTRAGRIPFSCSMGMYRGEITVIPNF